MPIPSPRKGESRKDFFARCMSDPVMREYPTEPKNQRMAICGDSWRSVRELKEFLESLRLVFTPQQVERIFDMIREADAAKESFRWALPILDSYKNRKGRFIKGVALSVGRSANMTNYEEEELKRAALTLIGKPLLVNHNPHRRVGDVDEADFEEDNIEYIARITDDYMWRKIQDREITHVSPLGRPRYWERTDREWRLWVEGKRAGTPRRIVFDELSLVAPPELAGDPSTSIVVMETLLKSCVTDTKRSIKKFEGELKKVGNTRS